MLAIRIMKPWAPVKALWFTLLLAGCFADEMDVSPVSKLPTVMGIQILDVEQIDRLPSKVRFRVINNLDRGICVKAEMFKAEWPTFVGIYIRDSNGKMLKPEPEGVLAEQDVTVYRLGVNASRTTVQNFQGWYIADRRTKFPLEMKLRTSAAFCDSSRDIFYAPGEFSLVSDWFPLPMQEPPDL